MKRYISKLRRWCIQRRIEGWKVKKICGHARVPRSTFYVWWNKYVEGGFVNLKPRSRRPKNVQRTEEEIVSRIVKIRRSAGWNEKAIAAKLERKEGIKVGHSTVYRVLSERDLINHLPRPRKQKTYRHWSRKNPNSLWQVDLCIYKKHLMTAFLDDCSRFLTDINLFRHGTTQNVRDLFTSAIESYGPPREVLSDHWSEPLLAYNKLRNFCCRSF